MPRLQSLTLDPLQLLARLDPARRWLLLHSGRFHARWASRSILATPTGTYRFIAKRGAERTGRSHWTGPNGIVPVEQFTHDPFDDLRRVLKATPTGAQWIGYLSYDLGRFIERLPSHAGDDRGWPLIELELCENAWVHDTESGQWSGPGDPPLATPGASNFSASNLRSVFPAGDFEKVVARTIQYIGAGDIFQANLAQRFTADLAGTYPHAARSLFQRMAEVSPAWFGAYLELGDFTADVDADESAPAHGVRRAISSISPELFLQLDANGEVITRPIKGTRPASVNPDVLRGSMKDIAELNMIVDLLRNDLGRVCRFGSVRVPEPRSIESHPTIHHGVATVTGKLRPEADVVDLLRATLPGGSITGAPKIRAMEVIDELEPVRRGPYCGVIGSLTASTANLSIAIRTALVELDASAGRGRVDFSVGGGIIADSVPAMEHAETLDKAAAILQALNLPRP